MKTLKRFIAILLFCLCVSAAKAAAQTNEFTYQGKLTDAGTQSATYDFEFRLCAAGVPFPCSPPLETIQRSGVPVMNGIFIVTLNFDAVHFNGANRFLDISVRRTNADPWTPLSPRQQITSAPYSIKSLNATSADNSLQLGGVAANQFVQTNDARLSDERNPLPNSPNYIQNTSVTQAASNFNVSGNGTAGGTLSGNVVNAATQFNLGGSRVLSSSGFLNLFAGIGAGAANSGGTENSFFGIHAGLNNTNGFQNAFFGGQAGRNNTIGLGNAFFGNVAGINNTTGNGNAFFGGGASNGNTTGSNNSTVGGDAGRSNTTGSNNLFLGYFSGVSNTVESNNSFIGASSNGIAGITNATALGYRARVTQSNSLVLGSISGVNGANADTRVGIGTSSPNFKLELIDPSNTGLRVQTNTAGGTVASFGGTGEFTVDAPFVPGGRFRIAENGNVGIGGTVFSDPSLKLSVGGTGIIRSVVNSDSNAGFSLFLNSSPRWSLATVTGGQFQIYNDATGQNAFWINETDNNVGIGTISPSAKLHVESAGLTKFMVGSAAAPKFLVRDDFVNIGASSFFPDPGLRLVVGGIIQTQVATGGFVPLCWSAQEYIATCSSSLHYKENVHDFSSGLDLLRRLRPVSFNWKANGTADLGLVAEEVNEIEPRLIIHNKQGEIEGVKYDRVGVLLINAVKEQQEIIERQQRQIDAMKKLVCAANRDAEICREEQK